MSTAKRLFGKDALWAALMLLPLLVGIALVYFSTVFGAAMSLTDWDIVRKAEWIGLDNYERMMRDGLFGKSVRNTLFFIAVSVPAKMALGLAVALLLNCKLRGIGFFRLTYFFPTACSIVAIALVWNYLYGNEGYLNQLLQMVGLPKVHWLDQHRAMLSVALMSVWGGMGYIALLFLAGLQNIPDEYYEASRVDGATKRQQFFRITQPLLTPTTFFVLVTLLIASFQLFGEVYIIQGPLNSTLSVIQYIFLEAFQGFRMGYASALAYVLVVVILAITVVQLRLQNKWVHYDM